MLFQQSHDWLTELLNHVVAWEATAQGKSGRRKEKGVLSILSEICQVIIVAIK